MRSCVTRRWDCGESKSEFWRVVESGEFLVAEMGEERVVFPSLRLKQNASARARIRRGWSLR